MGFWWINVSAAALLDETFAVWNAEAAGHSSCAKRAQKRAAAQLTKKRAARHRPVKRRQSKRKRC